MYNITMLLYSEYCTMPMLSVYMYEYYTLRIYVVVVFSCPVGRGITVRRSRCPQYAVDCWLVGGRAPSGCNGFVFGCCIVDDSLSLGHRWSGKGFFRKLMKGGISSLGTQLSMKAPILWWRFFDMIDLAVDFAPRD